MRIQVTLLEVAQQSLLQRQHIQHSCYGVNMRMLLLLCTIGAVTCTAMPCSCNTKSISESKTAMQGM